MDERGSLNVVLPDWGMENMRTCVVCKERKTCSGVDWNGECISDSVRKDRYMQYWAPGS